MSDVSVIIPNWNRSALLELALQSLDGQTLAPASVVVVDNGSTDDSVATAKGHGAQVVRLSENLGFSRAVNEGMKKCTTRWALILNNDAELAPGALERLREAASRTGSCFVAPRILRTTDRTQIDATFDLLTRGGGAFRAGHGVADGVPFDRARRVNFAPFTALLVDREAFQRAGGLDERLNTYMEDIEFCLRCRLAGQTGYYEPTATAFHIGSATDGEWSSRMVRLVSRNQLLIVAMHWPKPLPLRLAWAVVVCQSLWGVAAFARGAGFAWLRGKWEALGSWREARNSPSLQARNVVLNLVQESEVELRNLNPSWFWRVYFALT